VTIERCKAYIQNTRMSDRKSEVQPDFCPPPPRTVGPHAAAEMAMSLNRPSLRYNQDVSVGVSLLFPVWRVGVYVIRLYDLIY
jgi:hypothetical protein